MVLDAGTEPRSVLNPEPRPAETSSVDGNLRSGPGRAMRRFVHGREADLMRLTHPGPRLAAACLFASCLAPTAGSAGVIRGTLWLTHPTPAARAAAEARSRSQVAQPGVSDAVIYIEDIPEKSEKKLSHHGWFSSKPKMPRVLQMDRRFMPRVISVTPGTE